MVAVNSTPNPDQADIPGITGAVLAELALQASRLPNTIHYLDDYHEVERSIRASDPEWRICLNGRTTVFRVGSIEAAHRHLLHALAVAGLPSAPKGTDSAFGRLLTYPALMQRTTAAALQGPLVGLSFVRRELATLAPHPTPTVVVRVPFVKQHKKSRAKRFSARRMRRAWTPIMAAWMEVHSNAEVAGGLDRPRSLFGILVMRP